MKIVYMGTPEFAVPGLKVLVENDYNIAGVITAPDKPKGRGQKLLPSPVKEYAEQAGLNILQPSNLKNPEFLEQLKGLNADLQIVVAFRMLPMAVWDMPPLGTFNLHASLLPQYRGAAPINWVLINGEKETGLTTFFLKHEIDTGDILFQEKEPIHEVDTAGSLYDRLMHKGAALILKTVRAIESGDYITTKQEIGNELKSAPKIFREDCEIDWKKPSGEIINFIRGLSPYPAAWANINGKNFKIYKAVVVDKVEDKGPGAITTDNKNELLIHTIDGAIRVLELQMEGKKRMTTEELLRGYNFETT